jgi:hypothetical protein
MAFKKHTISENINAFNEIRKSITKLNPINKYLRNKIINAFDAIIRYLIKMRLNNKHFCNKLNNGFDKNLLYIKAKKSAILIGLNPNHRPTIPPNV